MASTGIEQNRNPDRSCGDCALCCKLGEIPGVKPFNQWCGHCSSRKGCDIYETRPQVCRDFYCHYLLSDVGEHWNPLKCRMVVSTYADPLRMIVSVDPSRPTIWRSEPYLGQIVHWSKQLQVTVMVGLHTYIVYPDHIDDLGEVTDEYTILTVERKLADGRIVRHSSRVLKSEAEAQAATYRTGQA